MTRADGERTKVHHKGEHDDFIVIVESSEAVKRWREDKSIPLIQVVDSFDVFCTHKHGAQGQLDRASKSMLENEYGTSKEDEVVAKILEKGDVQEVSAKARQGERNIMNGPAVGGNMGPIHN